MKKHFLVLSCMLVIYPGFGGCQTNKENAKLLAYANQIDSIGLASSVIRKQIESIAENPDSESVKAWHLLDSLGHLRDPILDNAQIMYREVRNELLKDTSSRLFRFLVKEVDLTLDNTSVQKREDSLFHAAVLLEKEKSDIKKDDIERRGTSIDSCMRYLNLELGWTKQATLDIIDSLGLFGMDRYGDRAQLRELLIEGYTTDANDRSNALHEYLRSLKVTESDVSTMEQWKHVDSMTFVAELMFQNLEFPLGRLLQELSRDTTDAASRAGFHFWSQLKAQNEILRKMNSLVQRYSRDTNGDTRADINSQLASLGSQLQATASEFEASREEYMANKK